MSASTSRAGRASSAILLLSSLVLSSLVAVQGCAGAKTGDAVRPQDPSAREAIGEKKAECTGKLGYADALVVDWDSAQRLDLEAGMKEGLVPVRYTCDEFRIIKGCKVQGDYAYVGVSK